MEEFFNIAKRIQENKNLPIIPRNNDTELISKDDEKIIKYRDYKINILDTNISFSLGKFIGIHYYFRAEYFQIYYIIKKPGYLLIQRNFISPMPINDAWDIVKSRSILETTILHFEYTESKK